MADHARALTFCIHENVRPSKGKQGYVIRRLLRRAVLDAYQMGRREPFLYQVVPAVAAAMAAAYPELDGSVPRIQTVVREEEEQFLKNLENGLKLLDDVFRKTKAAGSDTISGQDAFKLHATSGIYIEVTESLAADQNLRVDRPGFDQAMKKHGEISDVTTGTATVFATGPLDTLKRSYHRGSEFLGYETTEANAHVIGILSQNRLTDSATASVGNAGPPVVLVLNRTPFYGESGGQVGDLGEIRGDRFVFHVNDTKKENDFTLHIGQMVEGTVTVNDKVSARVDAERRNAIRRAHSATHVLHHALHQHLGAHAQQAGSKVEPDRLRFDFANPEAVNRERLRSVEETVNRSILRGEPITWTTMPIAEARTLGAMALFGEKYPDVVRVVTMGDFSRELCGGTHLDNTAQVGLFKIVGEESVSAGTRRINALTGEAALDYVRHEEDVLAEAAAALKVSATRVGERINALLDEIKTLKKEAAQRRTEKAEKVAPDDLLAAATTIGETKVVTQALDAATPDELRQLIDVLRRKSPARLAVLLATAADGKVHLAAGMTPDLVAGGLSAGQWIKEVAPIVGGGGGGKADLAQAGGKNPDQIPAALERAVEFLKVKLGG
jgi:alanyl-tRNA synthetase